ncbi:MAG: DNA-protecting protein DprA [bacterium]|nr:DNA-protecting protein DprA [bacterium]
MSTEETAPRLVRLTPAASVWPSRLAQVDPPPRVLWCTGQVSALAGDGIAMVGTRRATSRGLAVARSLGAACVARGWTVVSGLALGVDAAAHRGALDAGGVTVAVMGTGSDQTYPAAHRRLRREIEVTGCCVTEYEAGTPPLPYNFPKRNRIIAGLARAVIVVEAPARSGALITALQAVDAGREVFAVPGPVDLDTSRGCHHLLREGAHLLESLEDLERVLGHPSGRPPVQGESGGRDEPAPGSAARWIFDRLDLEGVGRDRLRERWPGTEDAWCEGLLALEMARLIRRLPGGGLARTIWRE